MTTRRHFVKQAGLAAAGMLAPQLSINAFAGAEDKHLRQLREAIAANAAFLKIPGLAAAVVLDGKVTFLQTEGFANLEQKTPIRRDHIFPVASITKTFAAVTLALYDQEGKISLDDYVLDYPIFSVGYLPENLPSPNVKLKHVISHTSEGEEPGSNYMYNGGRYNLVYNVFEKVGGNTKHFEAFASEVNRNIIQPLGMQSSLTGYPTDKSHPLIPRIVTTYNWDKEKQSFKADKGLPGSTTLYPSSGLLTTIDDLVIYTNALDQNALLTAKSYKKMTAPFVTPNGRTNPYGLGWASSKINGHEVHWGYGYGDSYSALIVRIPQQKLSFILLTNSSQASEPFYLGYGNLLNSPFARAFFRHIVFKRDEQFTYEGFVNTPTAGRDALFYDEIFGQILMRHYAERNYNEHKGEALELMRYLAKNNPERFNKLDIILIYEIAKLANPEFKPQMESAIAVYVATGWFHPDIHREIAGWYELVGDKHMAVTWYHKLADSKGYGEQGPVKNACNALGKYYTEQGDKEKGRIYYWRAGLFSRHNSTSMDGVNKQLTLMKSA